MALVRPARDRPEGQAFLSREELGEMLSPASRDAYAIARARLVGAEALEVALVVIVVGCGGLLFTGHVVGALVGAATALPVGAILRFVSASRRRASARARGLAQWGRVRHRVSVRTDAGATIASAVSCTVDVDAAHRAMLEGGVAAAELTELDARRFDADADVELYEAVAELEAEVAQREDRELQAWLERDAEHRDELEQQGTRDDVVGHLRFLTGGWR